MSTGGGIIPLSPSEIEPHRIVAVVRQLIEGRSNAVGICTLTANAGSTTVSAPNCGPMSAVFLMPTTANAAAIVAATYVSSVAAGSFTVTHTNSASTGKTFFWVALG